MTRYRLRRAVRSDIPSISVICLYLLLAAFAALSLGAAVVPAYAASTIAGDAAATRMQQTGALGG
jgi:hypothetical protein